MMCKGTILIFALIWFQPKLLQTQIIINHLPDRIPFFVSHCNVYCNGTRKEYIRKQNKITPWCMTCNCDKHCDIYGNCCPDIVGNIRSLKNNGVRCVATHVKNDETFWDNSGYFMISSCPISCDSPYQRGEQDWGHHVNPVTSFVSHAVFKNAKIAQCNNELNFTQWKKQMICDTSKTGINSTTPNFSDCMTSYQPPTTTWSTLRKCDVLISAKDVISECNITGKWRYYDDVISYNCKSLNFPVNDGARQFRNIYCYMCNGFSVDQGVYTQMTPKFKWSSVYDVLLCIRCDQTPVSCSVHQWYDPIKKVCRTMYCGEGKMLKHGKCEMTSLATNSTKYNYKAMIVFEETSSPTIICDYFVTEIATTLAEFLSGLNVFEYALVFEELSSNKRIYSTNVHALSVFLHLKTRSNTPRRQFEDHLHRGFTRKWDITFNDTQFRFSLSDFARHQFDIDYTKTFMSYPNNGSCCHTIPGISNLPDSSRESGFHIDITQAYFCPSVKLNVTDFNWTDNGSVVLKYANVKLCNGNFSYRQEHEIFVCIEQLDSLYAPLLEMSDMVLATRYISHVCTLLSMSCLVCTFVTFCVFPSLRTTPSTNTLHLVIFLFLAQGFLQFGLSSTDSDVLCKGIGILIHYFWLSSILWMNVCSFHMFSVFVVEATRPIYNKRNNARLIKYRIYANGTPAIIITAIIIVSLMVSKGAHIGYGDGRCYLSTNLYVVVAFYVPLALVVISNIVFFLCSVYTISKVNRLGVSIAKGRENIIIYGKLSVLTGMFWIFALISKVLSEESNALSLVSVILNGTQGVFIFASYTANRRVFALWKGKCSAGSLSRNRSRSTQTSSM